MGATASDNIVTTTHPTPPHFLDIVFTLAPKLQTLQFIRTLHTARCTLQIRLCVFPWTITSGGLSCGMVTSGGARANRVTRDHDAPRHVCVCTCMPVHAHMPVPVHVPAVPASTSEREPNGTSAKRGKRKKAKETRREKTFNLRERTKGNAREEGRESKRHEERKPSTSEKRTK